MALYRGGQIGPYRSNLSSVDINTKKVALNVYFIIGVAVYYSCGIPGNLDISKEKTENSFDSLLHHFG